MTREDAGFPGQNWQPEEVGSTAGRARADTSIVRRPLRSLPCSPAPRPPRACGEGFRRIFSIEATFTRAGDPLAAAPVSSRDVQRPRQPRRCRGPRPAPRSRAARRRRDPARGGASRRARRPRALQHRVRDRQGARVPRDLRARRRDARTQSRRRDPVARTDHVGAGDRAPVLRRPPQHRAADRPRSDDRRRWGAGDVLRGSPREPDHRRPAPGPDGPDPRSRGCAHHAGDHGRRLQYVAVHVGRAPAADPDVHPGRAARGARARPRVRDPGRPQRADPRSASG